MYLGEERREAATVRDIPLEIWIKIIGGLMALLVAIGGAFGVWIGTNIESMAKNIAVISGGMQVQQTEINNLKGMVIEIKATQRDFAEKLYSLDGDFKSWQRK